MNTDDDGHFGRIARLLTPSRRAVLEVLAERGPMTAEQIAECWCRRDAAMVPALAAAAPRMVTQSLWKLENLGFVQVADGQVALTQQGARALDAP